MSPSMSWLPSRPPSPIYPPALVLGPGIDSTETSVVVLILSSNVARFLRLVRVRQ